MKKSLRRCFSVLLAATMVFTLCLTGCSKEEPSLSLADTTKAPAAETTPVRETAHIHSYETETVALTCTTDGYTKNMCTVCSYVDTIVHSAPGHTYLAHVVNEPTCTENGMNKEVCTVCGTENPNTILTTALGHDYTRRIVSDPGCVTDGQATHVCNRCNDTFVETINATGHNFSDPTCTSSAVCSTCGTHTGSALGHTTSTGNCSRCGYNFTPPIVINGYYELGSFISTTHYGVLNLAKGDYTITVTTNLECWTVGITNEGFIAFGDKTESGQFTSRWDLSGGNLSFKALGKGSYTITIKPIN